MHEDLILDCELDRKETLMIHLYKFEGAKVH